MGLPQWSKTPSDNGQFYFNEGQAPSTVNDHARAVMADLAKYRDDMGGQLITGGSANVYTLATNSVLTGYVNGTRLSVRANHTNTAASTANTDTLGTRKIRKFTAIGEVPLSPGDMVAGGHYAWEFDANADSGAGAWILTNPTTVSNVGAAAIDIGGATDLTAPAGADEILVRDVSAEGNRRLSLSDLLKVISGLSGASNLASDDELAVYDKSQGAAVKTTVAALLAAIAGLEEDTAPDTASDFLLLFDASSGTPKKVKPNSLPRTVTDYISGTIRTPTAQDYPLALKIPVSGTITETVTRTSAGTCTCTWKVNNSPLGATNSASTSRTSAAQAAGNSFVSGDDIVLTVSAPSSAANLSFTVKYTRAI